MKKAISMRKFFYHFFCYTGLIIATINQPAYSIPLPFSEEQTQLIEEYRKAGKPIIETDNEFLRLYVVYLLADKLYPEGKINDDMTGFLRLAFPKTDISKLQTFATWLKTILMVKRRYVYVVDRLKHKIKADSILPKDSPIIAKDGEFAPADAELHKTTGDNTYQVSYTPYKYIEYDKGELGEPVRRRDKNYEPADQSALDEITLAILELDIKRFYQALRKLPKYNDGTREKTVELENGLKSRLILGTSHPGKLETIDGVLDIDVPAGWYINGDYLNPVSRPKFYLQEDGKEDLNIKEYQLLYPMAAGVTSNGVKRRIWYGNVRFPLRFTRRNINKGMNIKGDFTFMLCQAKTDKCHMVTSHNSLKLAPSVTEHASTHAHYVDLGFARVPHQRSRNAELKSAYYDKKSGQLTLKFKTDKTFNNVAVMAEDAKGTNFGNPQYTLKDDEVIATFDTLPQPQDANVPTFNNYNQFEEDAEEIAVTARFDDSESLRTVTTPLSPEDDADNMTSTEPNYEKAFLFGLILSLMPGVLYLLQRLCLLFSTHPHHRRILLRYTLSTAAGVAVWGIYNHFHPWYNLIEHPALLVTCLLIAVSYTLSLSGYMNLNLFRPFRKVLRRGVLIAIISVFIVAVIPTPFKSAVMDNVNNLPLAQSIKSYTMIWLGMMTLPIAGYLWRLNTEKVIKLLSFINLPYMLLFIAGLLWLLYSINGWGALIIGLLAALLAAGLWYIYPLAVTETVSHKRSFSNKTEVFETVQTHWTIGITTIWLVAALLLTALTPIKATPLPAINELTQKIQQDINIQPILLIIAQPQTYYSGELLKKLEDGGVKILYYKVSGYDKNLPAWLKAYNLSSPPLNILYNRRHQRGLSLPQKLQDLDWNEATAEFK